MRGGREQAPLGDTVCRDVQSRQSGLTLDGSRTLGVAATGATARPGALGEVHRRPGSRLFTRDDLVLLRRACVAASRSVVRLR
jgi:hypothetical protein